MVAEHVDSACERETSYKFARRVEVALPRVVVLATCCSPAALQQWISALELVELVGSLFSPVVV